MVRTALPIAYSGLSVKTQFADLFDPTESEKTIAIVQGLLQNTSASPANYLVGLSHPNHKDVGQLLKQHIIRRMVPK